MANPVMTASGTFSFGLDEDHAFDIEQLGAVVTKTVTLRPRAGSPQTRTAETPAGMLNAIGLQNPGVDEVVGKLAPRWARWQVPVIVSILGATIDEYGAVAERLDGVPGVSGIEVNISSPNAKRGGMEFGQDPETAAAVTEAVVRGNDAAGHREAHAQRHRHRRCRSGRRRRRRRCALRRSTRSRRWRSTRAPRRPAIGSIFSGLSGPAIKPVALRMVYQVAAAVDVPIVGCGGISTGTDAIEFLLAGATAVQVGTATFVNPRAPIDVLEGIEAYMRDQGVDDVRRACRRGASDFLTGRRDRRLP